MKTTLIALAILASFATAAQAQVTSTGTVQSTVNGGTSSYSVVNNVNQSSAHGSTAAAQNTAGVSSAGYQGILTSGATTGAATSGSTFTAAGGIGQGGSAAGADQFGNASIKTTVGAPILAGHLGGAGQTSSVGSNATVGTISGATNTNSGLAISGSNAQAQNNSGVLVGAVVGVGFGGLAGHTSAAGQTVGVDHSATYGGAIGGAGNSVTAGGNLTIDTDSSTITNVGSVQNGTFSGNVKVSNQ